MLKKRRIAINTFIFTSILITLVIIISFGILYVALPDYYSYTKHKSLEQNADDLAKSISKAQTHNEMTQLISDFSSINNAVVTAFDYNDELILELSSPFNMFSDKQSGNKIFTIRIEDDGGNEKGIETDDEIPFVDTFVKNKTLIINRSEVPAILIHKDIEGNGIGYIEISGTLQPISEAKRVIISLAPYLLIIDILIALIASYFYSKKITKPILRLSDIATKMQTMTPNIVSGIRTNDEMGELSENLDLLYMKLCSNIDNLQHEMDKVAELGKSKTDFMRAASHELKTPISALNCIVEGMLDNVGKYKDKDKYLLESKKLIDNMTKLSNEILHASKLETTENIISLEPVRISELIENSLDTNQWLIDEKKLNINFQNNDYLIISDKDILKKTISNIISNAVKYSPDNGSINIIVSDAGNLHCLSVENQSDNIPENELKKLFEPFYTLNYSRSRSKSGTGLGLYIVKRNLETLQLPYKLENTKIGLKFSIYFEKAT